MSSSLPDGFTVRAAARDDIEAAAVVVRAEEQELRGHSIFTADDLSDFWRYADFDGGSWIVESEDDVAAFAACIYRDVRAECWATVHPDFTGRGLATYLLGRLEERARELRKPRVRVGTLAENDAAQRLFARLGYRDVRHFFQMRIEFDGPPDGPRWPDGVVAETFRLEDAQEFHRALNEAFDEEWGFYPVSYDEWREHRLEAPDTDLSLWFVARDGEEIAGVLRCEANRDGGGWIGALGVLKPWRRRGVGLALLQHAFGKFHRRGVMRVGLGVDAENPSGATRLYERAGMSVLKEDVIYEKELT